MLRSRVTAAPSSPIRGISPGLMLSNKRTPANPRMRPSSSAGEREREAFRQQLADDLTAACAKSGARGEFALSRRGSCQEQIGDIGARNEENEADSSEQNQKTESAYRRSSTAGATRRRIHHPVAASCCRRCGGTGPRRGATGHWPAARSRRASGARPR